MQIYVSRDSLGEEPYADFKKSDMVAYENLEAIDKYISLFNMEVTNEEVYYK